MVAICFREGAVATNSCVYEKRRIGFGNKHGEIILWGAKMIMDTCKVTLLSVMVIAWSFYYILDGSLITAMQSPYLVGLLLRLGTFLTMTVVFILSKRLKWVFRSWKGFTRAFLVATVAFLFDFLINVGLQYSSASSGTALLKTEILFVFLLDAFIRKKHLNAIEYILSILMAVGVFLIVAGERSTFDIWSILFVISAMLNSFCAFGIKKIQADYSIDSYQIAYFNNIVSLILYAIVAALFVEGSPFAQLGNLNLCQLLLCVLCQTLLMLTYYKALQITQVWIVKVVQLAIPILTILIQFFFYGEALGIIQYIGITLSLMSALFLIMKSYTGTASD